MRMHGTCKELSFPITYQRCLQTRDLTLSHPESRLPTADWAKRRWEISVFIRRCLLSSGCTPPNLPCTEMKACVHRPAEKPLRHREAKKMIAGVRVQSRRVTLSMAAQALASAETAGPREKGMLKARETEPVTVLISLMPLKSPDEKHMCSIFRL